MKARLRKNDVVKVVQIMQNVISSRASIPVLSHVLLNAGDNTISLSATDLEVGVKCFIPADVLEGGSFTLPGKTFFEITRFAPEDIMLEGDGEHVRITSGKSRFKINTLPSEEFPRIPDEDRDGGFKLSKKDVQHLAKKTLFAVSREESRYALNGVFWKVSGGIITAVSTDGRRLSIASKKISGGADDNSAILPSKGVGELIRITEDSEDDVDVLISENDILFRMKSAMLMARLIKGEYVDYEKIIPKKSSVIVRLDKESFLSVLKRVSILTSESSRVVRIELGDNRLSMAASTELGESSDEIEIDYSGEAIHLAFNPEYLADYLQNEPPGELLMEITNSKSPVVFRRPEGEDFKYIIMPLKIN